MKVKVKDTRELNALLLRKGYSKQEFSKVLGVSAPWFVLISNGDRRPGPAIAKRIAEVLQVDWGSLFEIEDSNVRDSARLPIEIR